jgi:hypothetical protein
MECTRATRSAGPTIPVWARGICPKRHYAGFCEVLRQTVSAATLSGKHLRRNDCRVHVGAALRDAAWPAAERRAYNQITTLISSKMLRCYLDFHGR